MLKIVIVLLCILIVVIFCAICSWRKHEIQDRVQIVPADYGTESDLVEIRKNIKVQDEVKRMSVDDIDEVEQGTEENLPTDRQLSVSPAQRTASATASESPGPIAFPSSGRKLIEGTQETEGF